MSGAAKKRLLESLMVERYAPRHVLSQEKRQQYEQWLVQQRQAALREIPGDAEEGS